MKKREFQKPEMAPEPMPQITPQMIENMRRILEAEGMVYYKEGKIYLPTEKGWKLLMEIRPTKEEIVAWGDEKIVANDTTKFGVTKSSQVENFIIGVKANKCASELSDEIKNVLKQAKKVEITIEVEGAKDKISAFGSPALKIADKEKIIVRKDDKIDNATIAILADKSASELKKELLEKLKNPKNKILLTIESK
jgi:hypothetical protein